MIPQNSKKDDSSFVDEEFKVIPDYVNLPQPKTDEKGQPIVEVVEEKPIVQFTEEDLMMVSETLWNTVPCLILDKLPQRDPSKLKQWNHQLYLYCLRKNINPLDYLFDEFGLLVATASIGSTLYKDYKIHYSKKETSEEKQEKKLSAEYERYNQIADEKQKAIESGQLKVV